jgi:F0F1-type ATP synthase assembly protein I
MKGNQKEDKKLSPLIQALRKAAPYTNIGWIFVVMVLMGLFGGRWIDGKMGTDPLFTLLGAFLGIAAGFYNFFKVTLKLK